MIPSSTVVTMVIKIAVTKCFFIAISSARSSGPANAGNDHIDDLDSDKRRDDAAHTIHQQVPAQERGSPDGAILHAAQGQWNKGNDNESVENYCRKDGGLRRLQMHDVQRL